MHANLTANILNGKLFIIIYSLLFCAVSLRQIVFARSPIYLFYLVRVVFFSHASFIFYIANTEIKKKTVLADMLLYVCVLY